MLRLFPSHVVKSDNPQNFLDVAFFLYSEKLTFDIQVFICRHAAIQPRCLNKTPHARPYLPQILSLISEKLNLTVRRLRKSAYHLETGRLSGTVPSDEAVDGSLFDMQADTVYCLIMPVLLGQISRFQ